MVRRNTTVRTGVSIDLCGRCSLDALTTATSWITFARTHLAATPTIWSRLRRKRTCSGCGRAVDVKTLAVAIVGIPDGGE